jgi:hypothetical protein
MSVCALLISHSVSIQKVKVIVINSYDEKGRISAYDGFETKEFYCGFNRIYTQGEILTIRADFWKNI